MAHSALTPVFRGLRLGLHGLVVALTALVAARAAFAPDEASDSAAAAARQLSATVGVQVPVGVVVGAVCVVFLGVYAAGGVLAGRSARRGASTPSDEAGGDARGGAPITGGTVDGVDGVGPARRASSPLTRQVGSPAGGRATGVRWFGVLTCAWAALMWCSPDAAYLAFPLFFLALHLLPRTASLFAVVALAALSVVGIAHHDGVSVGGVVGPLVGAGVAVLMALGYRALVDEADERERLVAELIDTRDELAASQHESGVLAERARLARDIHDTVAQGLSSIQLLLHAAERSAPDHPALAQVRLARETAAANLADTRRFIRELAPPALDDERLAGALRRLAATQWNVPGLQVHVRADDLAELPMHLQTALLRIAQGAVANVMQHAHATRVDLTLTRGAGTVRLAVTDDGRGFDIEAGRRAATGSPDSFGLAATGERVDQLGGTLNVASTPGVGTTLTVELPWENP